MFKNLILVISLLLQLVTVVNAQLNISLVGQLPYDANRGKTSDIWGYVDTTGKEYALVGLERGTSIVDISTPSSPIEVFYSSGATTTWRDLKVWDKHAYIVNEGSNGLKIIDMSSLPGAITAGDVYQYTGSTYNFSKAHDIYIDENGYAYILGANNGNGGAIILDLNTDPKNPVEVGRYDDYYIHDAMVRGDTMWAGCLEHGFAVVDVSDKANPTTMALHPTPSLVAHNCWISDDGQTVFTTDEVSGAFLTAYDISDLSNINELDRIQSSPGDGVIPHNTFVKDDYLVTSYYADGVTIHDVSNPNIMVEVGNYDTSPQFSGNGFNGCWGVYPYLPSGLIIASDIENGLYVLGPTYSPASFLTGNVTDTNTTAPLDAVQIDLVSTSISTNTNIIGDYQTGIATSGTYDITFTKLGYRTKTIQNVVLTAGNTTILDVELFPLVPFVLQGQVVEAIGSNPIPNAEVRIMSYQYDNTVQTDGSGNFSISNFIEGDYDIYIGKWGYDQLCLSNEFLTPTNNPHVYQLNDGYYDDFTLDLGWTVTGAPVTGDWEKGTPALANSGTEPDQDVSTDCMSEAYVTGNGGGGAGADDIDDGQTILTSPVFDLSGYADPYIHFDRWFYNGGGSGSTPNDSLVIELSNGVVTSMIDFADVNDSDLSSWASKSIQVSGVMTATSTMQLIVRAMDLAPGHLSEAGLDKFMVSDGLSTDISIKEIDNKESIDIYPNPFNENINIQLDEAKSDLVVEVYSITGKLIEVKSFESTSFISFKNDYTSGVYFIKVKSNNQVLKTEKLVKF